MSKKTVILKEHGTVFDRETDVATTLLARDYKGMDTYGSNAVIEEPQISVLGNVYGEQFGTGFAGNVYDSDGLSPTLSTMEGCGRQPHVVEEPVLLGGIGEKKSNGGTQYYQQDQVYDSEAIAMAHPASLQDGSYKYAVYDEQNGYVQKDDLVGTLTTDGSSPKHNNRVVEKQMRIRKLTPRECWRLMGQTDEMFEKAEAVNSDTQLYKQAGNSIVVDVLVYLMKAVFEQT